MIIQKLLSGGLFVAILVSFSACHLRRSLLSDTIILKNGNSKTGTVINRDSTQITLLQHNFSKEQLLWADIDRVVGYKFRTGVLSFSLGGGSTPYYSVFRQEAFRPTNPAFEIQWGTAKFRRKYHYLSYVHVPSAPFTINKFTYGRQFYLIKTYLAPKSAYFGAKGGLMFVQFNNIPQAIFEPYIGAAFRLTEQWRLTAQLGTMFNLAGRNRQRGATVSLGVQFLFRNFKKRYANLNQNHF